MVRMLPTLAILSVVGSAAGVYLGRSAIAEIDPLHFEPPPARFHADLAGNRSTQWAEPTRPQYLNASLIQGLGTGCVLCEDYPEEYHPIQDRSIEDYTEQEEVEEVGAADPAPADQSDDAGIQVEPHAYHAVTAEEDQGQEHVSDAPPADMAEADFEVVTE